MSLAGYSTGHLLRRAKRAFRWYSKANAVRRSPFYRRYPYTGSISIVSVDARGLVNSRLGIFFNRIPKAANSTVVGNIARLTFDGEVTSPEAKRMFPSPSQLSSDQVLEFADLYKFTFVRNPYTRTLSAYLDKVVRPRYLNSDVSRARVSNSLRRAKTDQPPSFREFCSYLEHGGLYADMHWAPQSSLMVIPYEEFDFIGRIESFDSDFRYVLNQISPEDFTCELKTYGPPPTSATKKITEHYDEVSHDIVARLFKTDFETFGYPIL